MKIEKAVITAAGPAQHAIPLQSLIAQDGSRKSVIGLLVEEVLKAAIDDVCIVIPPGQEKGFRDAIGPQAGRCHLVPQPEALGYGHAIHCADAFAAGKPVLHLVGDHLYVNSANESCARSLIKLAEGEACSVSAVQPTRETALPFFGTVGGRRITGKPGVYRVDSVIEKPTATEAEQKLMIPGLRAGHYLCFFGMHVLTPVVMEILGRQLREAPDPKRVTLSSALAELNRREQYLALENPQRRYDVGSRYGLMFAQMALALTGVDREDILLQMLEMFALRGNSAAGGSSK